MLNRYNVGKDGRTAFRRLRGIDFNKKVPDFGECIWYLKPKSKGRKKAEYRWAEGVWVGVRDESGEHLVLTIRGALSVMLSCVRLELQKMQSN